MEDVMSNVTRASVVGKVPKHGQSSPASHKATGKTIKAGRLDRYSKRRVRRLKRQGEISAKAAAARGL